MGETVPSIQLMSWLGIAAAPQTPRPIVDRLNGELRRALELPRRQAVAGGNRGAGGALLAGGIPRRIETEVELYTKIAEANGIKGADRPEPPPLPQPSFSETDMKILYFDDYKLGVLKGDTVVDVSSVVQSIPHTGPHDLINGLIERFAEYRPRLEQAAAGGKGVPVAGVRIRPPLPRPVNIDCMAVNYMEDGTRTEPALINAFHKSPNAVIGPGDTMVLPDVPATIFEGEAEVAVVIGKRAKGVKAADAMSCVFGYVNFIDGSGAACRRPATCSTR